ncbi:MAG: DUF4149 domain-containing protein [Gallionella sp.]|nr:DUF4149 domain-containing protein [Gallionella sp.]
MALFKLIHLLAVMIWVGGMFFAHMVLRPAAAETLDPPQRLKLMDAVFRRFFVWVWGAVGAILATGFYLIYLYGGFAHIALHVHIMLALGLAMVAIYGYVFFACYKPFSLHVAGQRWKEAGEILGRVRKLIALNLVLGLITVCVVAIGVAHS